MPIRSPSDSEDQRTRLLALAKELPFLVLDAADSMKLNANHVLFFPKNFRKAQSLGITSSEDLISKLQEYNSSEEWRHSELRENFQSQSDVCRKLDDLFVTLLSLRTLLNSLGPDEASAILRSSGSPSDTASSPIG